MAASVFICYRRDGWENFAQLFRARLVDKGYRVIGDIESLGGRMFSNEVLNAIEQADVFLVLLTKGALDRCVDEHDWIRREIAHALSLRKLIIPIFFKGFEFPKMLPEEITPLAYYNGMNFMDLQYLDIHMERLVRWINECVPFSSRIPQDVIPTAYEGDKPYIFVSYAHKDKEAVMPMLGRLQSEGFRVWFDKGIPGGDDSYTQNIENHLENCSVMVIFMTKRVVDSEFCRLEAEYAQRTHKPIYVIYLEETVLRNGFGLMVGGRQSTFKYEYPSEDDFWADVLATPVLQVAK